MLLSKKHGLNPSVGLCFWCGEDTGELLLFGAHYPGGGEAPHRVVASLEPCPACKKSMPLGITLVECTDTPPAKGVPEVSPGKYPTGRWMVISEEGVRGVFKPEAAEQVLLSRKAAISPESFAMLLPEEGDG